MSISVVKFKVIKDTMKYIYSICLETYNLYTNCKIHLYDISVPNSESMQKFIEIKQNFI